MTSANRVLAIRMRKYAREYIEKYPSMARLNQAITGQRRMGSVGTVEGYIKGIRNFVGYLKESDPEITLEKLKSGEIDPAKSVDSFIDYLLAPLNEKREPSPEGKPRYAHRTARNYVFGVKKWFDLNGIKVNWKTIELPTSTEGTEDDRAPTKDELKRLLSHASSARDRFIIEGNTSNGLRIGTFLSLKIADVDLNYPDVARLTVERKRGRKFSNRGNAAGRFFCTYMTPEAKTALQEYLAERENAGETLTPESPLISDYNSKGQFISVEAFERVWARLLKRAGLDQKSYRYYVLHVHTLRKYFRSNCIGVDASYRERWMGHKGLYLDMSYFKAEEPLHLAEYRKAIPHLTINQAATEEKKLRTQMLIDFAKLQGYEVDQLKKLEEVLARAKDIEEGISEFRKLGEQAQPLEKHDQPRHIIAKGDDELLKKLDEGYKLVEPLENARFLMTI